MTNESCIFDNFNSKSNLTCNGSKQSVESYVPADHRPASFKTSTIGALAHLLKASLSSGVLAMPLAFKNAGLLVGSVGTIIVGLVCTHAIHILVKTSQELCVEKKKPYLGYAETCDLVFQNGPHCVKRFAPFVREVADWALALTHLGACCVYIVVVAESFKQVSDEYGGPDWSVNVYCALTLVILGPLTQITTLKYLVPFSTLANFIWLASICISVYYCWNESTDFSERNLVTSISGIPVFVSTCLFAMEGIGVVMPLENEMLKPHQFLGCPGVLNVAMTLVVVLYGFVGFSGYLRYGEAVRGSITLNLPQDEILAQTAKILVACVMMLSYALIYYVPIDVVWRKIQDKKTPFTKPWRLAILRFCGTLITVCIAVAVPRLELFMQLIGALCLSLNGLLLPAIVETIWKWENDLGQFYWVLWKNLMIAFISIVAMVSGATYAIYGFLNTLNT